MTIYFFRPILILMLIPAFSYAQRGGFIDDFEDGTPDMKLRNGDTVTLWSTNASGTYQLKESDGKLNIEYRKKPGSGSNDNFMLVPPRRINVSSNPHINISVKSSVKTALTIHPVYSMKPPTYEVLSQEIPGDDSWHTYTFTLYRYLYSKFSLQTLEFYFDKGSSEPVSGVIQIDDLKIAGYLRVIELQSSNSGGNAISLFWKSTYPDATDHYKIYRDNKTGFTVGEDTYLADSKTPGYTDRNLNVNEVYFYKVVPVHTSGQAFFPSEELRQETFTAGSKPSIKITGINSNTVRKYEKFEIALDLENVMIHNPYNSEDIDVFSWFRSPAGDTTWINGFYDDYMGADQWKVRFSPSLEGEWEYKVFVKDAGGVGESPGSTFTAINSEHHGWIKPSKTNPHYFTHDDGTSYYAVGVYSPWRNDEEKLNTYAKYNANLFAIWDIGYGGFVNGTGIIEEELGRYNQMKLGRIDSLLTILESDDIQLMYAIWPHDLFSETVWAAEWDKNPYNQLIDVVDVYADPLVWKYQERKYRYMIARFAHSRSMGIWELINEMNGTDGWAEARYQEAYDWVERADKYFEENDPYNHPVTASFSGGFDQYREPLYERNDVPNIHMYPAQGWIPHYPEDSMRSSMYNYAWASRRFWDSFEKPAIFGESGADLAYYKRTDPEYHEAYHNAIWASLSNGLAGIPVWWSFRHLSDQDWNHLKYIRDFVSDIDFANVPYDQTIVTAEGCDAYGLSSGTSAFGWIRSYSQKDVSGIPLSIEGFEKGSYTITWFDTWRGEKVDSSSVKSNDGTLIVTVPKISETRLDIAFKIINAR